MRPFREGYFEIPDEKKFSIKMNMSSNSLMALMVGIKYYGALHLRCYITNDLLQI